MKVLFLVMFCFITLIGCSNLERFDQRVNFTVKDIRLGTFGTEINQHNLLTIVYSLDELIELSNNFGNRAFDPSSVLYYSEENSTIRSFNNNFFAEHALIVISTKWHRSAERVQFRNIGVINNDLIIRLSYRSNEKIMNDDAVLWMALISVSSVDVTNINSIFLEVI